jgi:hypothetical protein
MSCNHRALLLTVTSFWLSNALVTLSHRAHWPLPHPFAPSLSSLHRCRWGLGQSLGLSALTRAYICDTSLKPLIQVEAVSPRIALTEPQYDTKPMPPSIATSFFAASPLRPWIWCPSWHIYGESTAFRGLPFPGGSHLTRLFTVPVTVSLHLFCISTSPHL